MAELRPAAPLKNDLNGIVVGGPHTKMGAARYNFRPDRHPPVNLVCHCVLDYFDARGISPAATLLLRGCKTLNGNELSLPAS
jgi:hypothetical protein